MGRLEDAAERSLQAIWTAGCGRCWEEWILDIDATVKPLYGRQEGAVIGSNPSKGGGRRRRST